MIIQILLIVVVLVILARFLSSRGTYYAKAGKKIAIVLLSILVIMAVLVPDITTQAANLVGVGRGADLLVYILFATFLFYAINQYVRSQDERDRLYRLARRVAIIEANSRYKL